MKILILSATCSKNKYDDICKKRTVKSLDTNQKFFLSIIDGFVANDYRDITCISILPVSYGTYPDRFIKRETENCENIDYIYCKTLNFPILRNLFASYQVKKELKRFLDKNKNEMVFVLTDGLFYEFSKACNYIHKLKKKVYTIVTDIPSYVSNMGKKTNLKGKMLNLYGRMTNDIISKKYDGYVFLTEQLNDFFNKNKKPYTIVEGLLGNYRYPSKEIKIDSSLPIVLYGGKLNKEFGVLSLAKASRYLHDVCTIEIYGSNGDCDDELCQLENENQNLHVNGIIPLNELLKKETMADLLINPRPNGQYFTKYSFPSKTLEYMSSGTPVLMYKLEGIPSEYDEFLYYINGTKAEDIAKSIKEILNIEKEKLREKGFNAQKFVRENKNAKVQVRKIMEMWNDNVK